MESMTFVAFMSVNWKNVDMCNICGLYHYRPQRSCGQGNIFTPVCHSVHRGVSSRENPPARENPPTRENPPGPGRHPPDQADPPWDQADTNPPSPSPPPPDQADPPRKQTPAYGQWAAGTHPTGMHSCLQYLLITPEMYVILGFKYVGKYCRWSSKNVKKYNKNLFFVSGTRWWMMPTSWDVHLSISYIISFIWTWKWSPACASKQRFYFTVYTYLLCNLHYFSSKSISHNWQWNCSN